MNKAIAFSNLCVSCQRSIRRVRRRYRWFRLIAAGAILACAAIGETIHVPRDHPTIQAGIKSAEDGDIVIVSDGVWKGRGNKNVDFLGLAITVRSENGPKNCIIDCEGNGRGFWFHRNETKASVLDGFTITNGKKRGHYGGGVCCNSSSPTITNCIIIGNHALFGGGVSSMNSDLTITNCKIADNSAYWEGGGIYSHETNLTIINCTITDNRSAGTGGGIYCSGADVTIANCTIIDNRAASGGGVYSLSANTRIISCILRGNRIAQLRVVWGDLTVRYSNVRGGWPGRGNIRGNPLFVTGPLGDFYLSHKRAGQDHNSPCLNAGLGKGKGLFSRKFTTRTDGKRDKRAVDMGFHWGR